MEEQVQRLNALDYIFTYIGRNKEDVTDIKNCLFTFLFLAPEQLLEQEEWRNMLCSNAYVEKRILIVIDEAHAVIEW